MPASGHGSTAGSCRSTTRLQSGDTCEIFTSKVEGAGPSRDWLKIVQSPRARNKIRQWFSRERRDDALESGREELDPGAAARGPAGAEADGLRRAGQGSAAMKYADLEALYVAVGEHHVSAKSVAQRVARRFTSGEEEEQLPGTARQPRRQRRPEAGSACTSRGSTT